MSNDVTIDQLLAISGIGTGPYGGGDVVRFSPDGRELLFYASLGGEPALWLMPREGGFPRRVTTAPITLPFLASPQQSFAPDGETIAFLSEHRGATELWLWEAEWSRAHPLTTLGNNISSYSWAADGRSLLAASNRRGTYDIYRVDRKTGATKQLTSDVRYEVSPVATPNGERLLYVRLDEHWQDHQIVSIAAEGGDEQVVASDSDFFDYHYGRTFGPPVLAPDGSRALFRSHRSGWINYWSVSTGAGEPQQLCPQEADQSGAVWSPDGQHVAFIANTNGTLAIWQCNADGSGPRPLVQPEMGLCQAPAWSPSGREIAYFFASPTEPQDLWLLDIETGATRRLTNSIPVGALRERLAQPEKIQYTSFDGLSINAYLYRPVPRYQAQRVPGVLLIHGGPTMQFSDAYDSLAQFLSQQGYAVLMPNIRGSSGYGKYFEDLNNGDWGHGDLRDAVAGANYLRSQNWVHAQIGITGISYGGCLSMSAVCFAPGAFQAAAPHAGYADWVHVMEEQERRHLQLMHYEFGPFATNREVYERCSPIFQVKQAETPVLVIHGEGQLPRSDASRRFVEAMQREYKTVEYKVYPNDSYYVRNRANVRQMYLDMADFFDRHLRA